MQTKNRNKTMNKINLAFTIEEELANETRLWTTSFSIETQSDESHIQPHYVMLQYQGK